MNHISSLYNVCEVVCIFAVCLGIQTKKSKLLRIGVYLFAIMEFVSTVGYKIFPLSDSGFAGTFQDIMHMIVTAIVVLLSIASLILIIIAGTKNKTFKSYAIFAGIALAMMMIGTIGMKTIPSSYFGVVERFSVFSVTGFNMVLGLHLCFSKDSNQNLTTTRAQN